METYTEEFVNKIISDYKCQLPKEYRKTVYIDKSQEEQFMEAISDYRIGYEHIIEVLDELFNGAVDDGKWP